MLIKYKEIKLHSNYIWLDKITSWLQANYAEIELQAINYGEMELQAN